MTLACYLSLFQINTRVWLTELSGVFLSKNDIGSDRESEALDSIYASMPIRDFSSDPLQRVPSVSPL
jgi:hypothetical protein